jgi:hypothetical protein
MSNKRRTNILLVVLFVLLLAACSKPEKKILGRWELVSFENDPYVVGGSGVVEQLVLANAGGPVDLEFYENNVISVYTVAEITTGEYSWVDQSHIKITAGSASTVYDIQLDDEEFIFLNDVTEHRSTFKKYQEYPISTETLSGTWHNHMFLVDESNCFRNDDIGGSPEIVVFGKDGSFSANGAVVFLGVKSVDLSGNYSIDGNRVMVSSTGYLIDAFKAAGYDLEKGYDSWGRKEIQSEVSCDVTLTNSRLIFTDDQGNDSIYLSQEYAESLAVIFGSQDEPEEVIPEVDTEQWKLISTAYAESESLDGEQIIDFELAIENHTSDWGYVTLSVDDPRALLTTAAGAEYYLAEICEFPFYRKIQVPPDFVRNFGSISCALDAKSDEYEISVLISVEKRHMIESRGWIYEEADELLAESFVNIAVDDITMPSYPFIRADGWSAYKIASPSGTVTLDPGQSWETDFGSIVFNDLRTDGSSHTLEVSIFNKDDQSNMKIYLYETHAFHSDGSVYELDDPYQIVPPNETASLEIAYSLEDESQIATGKVCFTVYEIPYYLWDTEYSEYTNQYFVVCFP